MRAPRRVLAGSLLALASLALSGCDFSLSLGPSGAHLSFVSGDDSTAADALVGVWRRVEFFTDASGHDIQIETIWTFSPGGNATRTVITTDLTLDIADTQLATALWSIANGELIIRFVSPFTGTARYSVRIELRPDGDRLFLNGTSFTRIG